jgi:glutamate/tyrosine decarboxylase-like PLP-dependent enzyme
MSSASEDDALLRKTAERAVSYLVGLKNRRVAPTKESVQNLDLLPQKLPEGPAPADQVVELLDRYGSPATVASNGGRYFGFVVGSSLPAALAANWLSSAWNQNAAMEVTSPVSIRLEATAVEWVRDLLGLPPQADGAFVSGATMANFAGLAAARHAVLERAGWDFETDGMNGAPKVTVIVGDDVHASALKALMMLGFGTGRHVRLSVDDQGRIIPDSLPSISGPSILCLQAGNVNTGAFDPFPRLVEWAHGAGAWVHVDGAFGLWAATSPRYRHLTEGISDADSWSTDAHKWLNVPYDSGLVFVRDSLQLRAAMAGPYAPYLGSYHPRDRFEYAPEMSRRARGVDAWAALMSLGRTGLADLIERCCRHASRFATLLSEGGCEVLNKVVLNQVLVSFGDDEATKRVVGSIQSDGTCWCGETKWRGRAAMRISVSSGKTTDEDVERSARAMLKLAKA